MPEAWQSFGPDQLRAPYLAELIRLQSALSRFVGLRRLAVHALAMLSAVLAFELEWPERAGPLLARTSRESWVIFAVMALGATLGEVLYARRLQGLVQHVSRDRRV